MKKKIFVSVVLVVIMVVTMSFGSFAYTATYSLSTNTDVEDSFTSLSLANASRTYSYHSYSMVLDCNVGVQSLAVMGTNKSFSNVNFKFKKYNSNYNSMIYEYGIYCRDVSPVSLDYFLVNAFPSNTSSFTTLYSYSGSFTTSSDSVSYSPIVTNNSVYYCSNVFNSYYKSLYNGQLDYSVAFTLQSYTQPNIYYN